MNSTTTSSLVLLAQKGTITDTTGFDTDYTVSKNSTNELVFTAVTAQGYIPNLSVGNWYKNFSHR